MASSLFGLLSVLCVLAVVRLTNFLPTVRGECIRQGNELRFGRLGEHDEVGTSS
jgi:hypothetical protein